jgi:predicted ATPase
LVTLTGSGGVGKTRLALQTAQEVTGELSRWCLAGRAGAGCRPGLLFKTVAAVFNLREDPAYSIQEALTDYLRPKQLLLVLDNCEHLILACARLADHLLASCPQLKLLASSRESLGVRGEVAYSVPSLPYPETGTLRDSAAMQQYPAVSLFIERAKAALPDFKLTGHNLAAITRICQRLDGIPLALELAAARMNILTTEQLAARLDDTFRLLVGGSRTALPRQQTLRATIDWSYDLLNDQERSLLRRLSVFAGGSTLEAVEAVCSGDGIAGEEILELLISLANKSIVQVERVQGHETRYRLLETVRQYAREKLFDARQSALLRDQHLDYFLALCERAEPQLRSAGRLEWNRRLTQDLDNLRAALEWAFRGPETAHSGLRMVTAIGFRFLTPYGYLSEASRVGAKRAGAAGGPGASSRCLQASAYNLLAEITENLQGLSGCAAVDAKQPADPARNRQWRQAVEMTWALVGLCHRRIG